MRKLVLYLVAGCFVVLVQGCATSGHQQFYSQAAPEKYPPTDKVLIFAYGNFDINEIYDLFFSDFLIVGRGGFNGPAEDPIAAAPYAESIGAHVLVTTTQFTETRTSFMTLSTPTSTTTQVSGFTGTGSFYGTATTYGTQTSTVPITVNRYDQQSLFLRNVTGVVPLWERTEAQYQRTESTPFEGTWIQEKYRLRLFRSGSQVVGFLVSKPNDREAQRFWDVGQLKLVFGAVSGSGVYLMANKTPMPARFEPPRVSWRLFGLS